MKLLLAVNKACELMLSWLFEFLFCSLFLRNSYSQSKAFADAWVFLLQKDPQLKKESLFFRSVLLNCVVWYGCSSDLSFGKNLASNACWNLELIREENRDNAYSAFYCRVFAEEIATHQTIYKSHGAFLTPMEATPKAHRFAHLVEQRKLGLPHFPTHPAYPTI